MPLCLWLLPFALVQIARAVVRVTVNFDAAASGRKNSNLSGVVYKTSIRFLRVAVILQDIFGFVAVACIEAHDLC